MERQIGGAKWRETEIGGETETQRHSETERQQCREIMKQKDRDRDRERHKTYFNSYWFQISHPHFPDSQFLCKFMRYWQMVPHYSSPFLLVAISADRFQVCFIFPINTVVPGYLSSIRQFPCLALPSSDSAGNLRLGCSTDSLGSAGLCLGNEVALYQGIVLKDVSGTLSVRKTTPMGHTNGPGGPKDAKNVEPSMGPS